MNKSHAGVVTQAQTQFDFQPEALLLIRTDLPFEMSFPRGCDSRVLRIPRMASRMDLTALTGRTVQAAETPLLAGMLSELEQIDGDARLNPDRLRAVLLSVIELAADRLGAWPQRLDAKSWFELFAGHIRMNVSNPVMNAEAIGRRYDVSGRFVHKVFADAGTTLSAFVHKCRLEHAYQLLTSGANDRIIDVAAKSGYNDLSYFCRQFKREFGVTATEARRRPLVAVNQTPGGATGPHTGTGSP